MMVEIVPDANEYEKCFDLFEYIYSLIFADLWAQRGETREWIPMGAFSWRRRDEVFGIVDDVITSSNETWFPLASGVFGGSLDRLARSVEITKEYRRSIRVK